MIRLARVLCFRRLSGSFPYFACYDSEFAFVVPALARGCDAPATEASASCIVQVVRTQCCGRPCFSTLRCPRSSVLVTALVVMLSIAGCVERVPAEVCAGVARVAA